MPVSVIKLARSLADSNVSFNSVARIIEFDEALTYNMLKLANSAMLGGSTRVKTVKEAIIRIGTSHILKFIVAKHLQNALSQKLTGYGMDENELWRHSVASALAAENVSQFLPRPVPGLSFTAALMHDIGKVLVNRHLNADIVKAIKNKIEINHMTYIEAEQSVLGTDHAVIGSEVAVQAKFPNELTTAIQYHHDPDSQANQIIDTVHIANNVAKMTRDGLDSEWLNQFASEEAPMRLGLTVASLEALCTRVQSNLNKAEELFRGE
jgi:putative nucleotidyltransferase with HDIG domain